MPSAWFSDTESCDWLAVPSTKKRGEAVMTIRAASVLLADGSSGWPTDRFADHKRGAAGRLAGLRENPYRERRVEF